MALLLSLMMLFTSIPAVAQGASDAFRVIVSFEGLTLGQGLYFEPKAYSLQEINDLIAQEGYGPYAQEELTAGMATLAFLIDHNVDYNMSGSWDSDAYLSAIKGIDKGTIDIPEIIGENGGPSNDDNDGNDDDYLGEFDYSMMSGWMITVNDLMTPVGCSQFGLEDYIGTDGYGAYDNTYVIRWQYTLYGYGADLGYDLGWGMPPYFEAAEKSQLYIDYVECTDAQKKAAVMKTMEKLTATAEEFAAASKTLKGSEAPKQNVDYETAMNETMAQLMVNVPAPAFGTNAGEWTVLTLARGGYLPLDDPYFEGYYQRVVQTVKDTTASVNLGNKLHKTKSTENSRLILALSAIGKDARDVDGIDLVEPLEDLTWVKKQGINGPIFTLLALDSRNYETEDPTVRQQCIDYILGKQLAGGGWALSGANADPDITSMALQALAKYSTDEAVCEAAIAAFEALSAMQKDDGGFASWGSVNSESIAQVIVACTSWYIDPSLDSEFVKDRSAVDALLDFYVEDSKGFAHVLESGAGYTGGVVNGMATDQACYALVAYNRMLNGQTALYDMTDLGELPELNNGKIQASISIPEKVEKKVGKTFNAVVNVDNWVEGYRLLDCIITVPENLKVNDIVMGSRIGGGALNYYFSADEQKLRIVYFDAQTGAELTVSGNDKPIELMNIEFEVEEELTEEEITVAIAGMTLKQNSDAETQLIVDITKAADTAEVVEGLSFSVMKLYTGDDIDLISAKKSAIAVAVTGMEEASKLVYDDGTDKVELRYSAEVSAKTGVATYVAMVSSSKALEGFVEEENYVITETAPTAITFGDTNKDGVINAQDALNTVNMWLRKAGTPNDELTLISNVNGDSRINTLDTLGVVDKFVKGEDFGIVNRAATLKNALKTN